MPYSEVLSKMITDSSLSIKEIADLCKKEGIEITPSYISQLKSGKINPPSDEISRAISKICGEHKNKLVLEAYLDRAPSEIIEFLNSTRYVMTISAFKIFENSFPPEVFEVVKQTLTNLPLSDFIIQINENDTFSKLSVQDGTFSTSFNIDEDRLDINLKDPTGVKVKDNSMFPTIPENSTVTIEMKEKYNDGDIICFFRKSEPEKVLIRKGFFKDKSIMLFPINSGYESLTLKSSDVTILGRVSKVIAEL